MSRRQLYLFLRLIYFLERIKTRSSFFFENWISYILNPSLRIISAFVSFSHLFCSTVIFREKKWQSQSDIYFLFITFHFEYFCNDSIYEIFDFLDMCYVFIHWIFSNVKQFWKSFRQNVTRLLCSNQKFT